MIDESHRHMAKLALCVLAALLAIAYYFVNSGRIRGRGRLCFDVTLVALALLSVVAYFEFGWRRFDIYMNPHDVYHYYIGAKYSQELQYHDLYRAGLIADRELGPKFRETHIRNLDDHSFESVTSVMARSSEIKSKFAPGRWEEFKGDIKYFRDKAPLWKWSHMLRDKGYNGAPVWNSLARWITNQASTSNELAIRLLTYIDLGLLLIMFAAVCWAFGWRAMLFVVIFHGLNYFMAFVHIKGAFMRLDWYVAGILAICLLKRRWYLPAGLLMAWAALSRIFPAIFVFGMGVKALQNLVQVFLTRNKPENERVRFAWRYVAFFGAFLLGAIVFSGTSIAADGGTHLWKIFLSKIELHNSDISTNRAGFKYVFLHDEANKAAAFIEHHTLWQAVLLGVLCISMLLMLRADDHEALSMSFIPFYFLVAPTFYYFVILMLPFLYFLGRPQLVERAGGMVLMFLVSAACFGLGFRLEQSTELFFLASCLLLGLCAYLAFCAVLPTRARIVALENGTLGGNDLVPQPTEGAFHYMGGLFSGLAVASASAALLLWAAGGTPAFSQFWTQAPSPVPSTSPPSATSIPGETPKDTDDVAKQEEKSEAQSPLDEDAPTPEERKRILNALSKAPPPPPLNLPSARQPGEAELAFGGDIMLDRGVVKTITAGGLGYAFPFDVVRPVLQAADIAFANLECPISGRGEQLPNKRYVFNAKPEAAAALADAGFDILSVANNHTLDYGPVALQDTVENVRESGVIPIGITVHDDPQQPEVREVSGIKIGYLAYADPVPQYSYAREFLPFETRPARGTKEILARDIRALRPTVDVLVVSMHWGVEYNAPTEQQIELGHYIIDQGADIVAGHHPHVQQDAQLYNGGVIIYSMGNFVFDQRSRPATREVRLYRVYVNKEGFARADYLPMHLPLDIWQPRSKENQFVPVTATNPPASMESLRNATPAPVPGETSPVSAG